MAGHEVVGLDSDLYARCTFSPGGEILQVATTRLPTFKPRWDARMGAEQICKAYLQSRLTLEDFEGPRYQRIGHIKSLLADRILDADLCHVRHPHRVDVPTALSVGSLVDSLVG
jgi:hypothetical protein